MSTPAIKVSTSLIKNLKFKFDESDGQIILPAYKQYPTHTFDGSMEMRTE